ncbi:MAG: RsmE family RNA methyltransferase [Acidobacteriota bacterium]
MTAQRFYIGEKEIRGNKIILDGNEYYHVFKVLRKNIGDRVFLFDGKGVEFKAEVFSIKRDGAELLILERKVMKREYPFLTLAQALNRWEKVDWIVEKSSEMGIDRIIPVITKRSRRFLNDDFERKKIERWKKISLEATKQSGGSFLPEVSPPVRLEELVKMDFEKKYYFSEKSGILLRDVINKKPKDCIFLIGPEGGFDEEEDLLLKQSNFFPISLGKRIWKAETASIGSLAIFLHFWKT